MHSQRGLSLISTLIVGVVLMSLLILAFKLVPVYSEYFGVKKAFAGVTTALDPSLPPATFRNEFWKYAYANDITSVDKDSILVTKEGGRVILETSYRREVPLFGNAGLYFDFHVVSE
ncbi:MAG: DUF4845 domain-containing protein [Candidatus Dactylopiibacterium carminicum]|uniref:DUF4845 domain-containing protein n=1 Tax=Candidatus Dactylopiibacterium carminicum TaxID=857335 RepID=A0A272ESR9_9RHOO|nr:DUF4845 domain-containing protein [Candidatus Dactylopiibacterium carminicum]KAF7599085.1 DUF4845 domain-containing protein [Candidatus Dactylopiibacterium carminicum]PAS93154.1 MAG: DUF4845 domain-containing protein [Candidatus Dactylopiibacterium carminicum]PAS96874.1 MAG: DUF4845 domain-containing protein [Candidatus Dactylopiibacterium carminicum]PAS99099.1 MAG: hypothetical protein BSR46_09695 [Candidatus Dactylopiibacterium carminicum]